MIRNNSHKISTKKPKTRKLLKKKSKIKKNSTVTEGDFHSFHNNLNSSKPSLSTVKLRRLLTEKDSSEKLPGRYYTPKELLKVSKQINEESKPHVISVDEYFYNSITKNIDISSDVEHIKSSPLIKDLGDLNKNDKRMLDTLKIKKGPKRLNSQPKTNIFAKLTNALDRLETEESERLRKQGNVFMSKMNTKSYKKLLKSVNLPFADHKRVPPPQRIKFRAPALKKTWSCELSDDDEETEYSIENKGKTKKDKVNKEIEIIMDDLQEEIKKIEDYIYRKKTGDIFKREIEVGSLAKSVWKMRDERPAISVDVAKLFDRLAKRKTVWMNSRKE
ncbi:unnamed protein product [Blepharisma stoltei]|uniref:Uncharacterized protein n=1 Tax=Blepharisma stoltei TaxID=1481888 RepID=A0AAU9IUU0_9CILI|nr:unnamed protein product [Blepharisma stoltei]